MFIGETLTQRVDLDSARDHDRPGDADVVRYGYGPMALEGSHMAKFRTERLSPLNTMAFIAMVTEKYRVTYSRQILAHHCRITAETGASKNEGRTGNVLA